jgi:hypothetical protein
MRLVPGNIKGIRQARMDHCRKECGVRSRGRESTVAAAAAPGEWPGPGPVGHGALALQREVFPPSLPRRDAALQPSLRPEHD